MSDCTVDGNTVTSNSTLLDVVGGSLSVSNSTFQHLGGGEAEDEVEGPGLLRAVCCRIHMVGVNCSNNKTPGGLIQVQNGSELFVQESTFENNVFLQSSVISLKFNSSLTVSHSVFLGNIAYNNGPCFWLDNTVAVIINQSTFKNNTAYYGGVIYQSCQPDNTCDKNHGYKQNSIDFTQSDFSGEGKRKQSLSIHDSYFSNNKARISGGVFYIYGTFISFFVKKCNFTENGAYYGGAIFMKSSNSTVVMQQCLFTNNSATESGKSLYLNGTHSQLTGCDFHGDIASSDIYTKDSTLHFQFGTSSINNCTFSEQAKSSIVAKGAKLNITNSRWYGHKRHCLKYDSKITIVGSQFAADAEVFLHSKGGSNLTAINISFTNGNSVFKSDFRSEQVQFINCSFNPG